MEAESVDVRWCSVRLWRGVRSLQSERGSGVPAAPMHAMAHAAEYDGVPAAVIKTECDAEDITPQEWVTGHSYHLAYLKPDTSSGIEQTHDLSGMIEEEVGDCTVKCELDIGPTVLQPPAAPSPAPLPWQDPPRGTRTTKSVYAGSISAGDASAVPRRLVFGGATSRTKREDEHYEEHSKVTFGGTLVLDTRTDNVCQTMLKEDSYDNSSVETREDTITEDCIKTQNENDFTANMSSARALYVCDYCKYNTAEESALINHMMIHTRQQPLKCEQCEYRTTRSGDLKKHMRIHTGEKPYKCEQCEYRASELHNLQVHLRTHTGEKPYKCKQCGYRASRIDNLQVHLRTHTGEKPYKCEQCEYSASQLGNLQVHLRTHMGEKPYQCKQCEYSASHRSSLKAHLRTHTGEKPFKCEQCGYSASRLDNLQVHLRTHTAEKPYRCEQCEYSASRLSSLKLHLRKHTGIKPYKCEQCEYSAYEQSDLRKHFRSHSRQKQFKCAQCEYSASRPSSLKRHLPIHSEENYINVSSESLVRLDQVVK